MKKHLLLVIILLVALIPDIALSAIHYIRTGAGGSNNGTNWTNAWNALGSVTWTRGDTYYIADGSYGAATFNQAQSGTTLITVKKAWSTAYGNGDHGPAGDWNESWGTGQATFSSLDFGSGYWTLDGQAGGGPGTPGQSISWSTGLGFKVISSRDAIVEAGAYNQINMHHIEITANNMSSEQDGIDGGTIDGTWSYLYFHDILGTPFHMLGAGNNMIIEHCHINKAYATATYHEETISDWGSDNVTFRYNYIKDQANTGFIIGINGPGTMADWKIYGNVFRQTGISGYVNSTAIHTFMDSSNWVTANNWVVYNNTFIRCWPWATIAFDAGSGNVVKNNLWYHLYDADETNYSGIGSGSTTTEDYNYWVKSYIHSYYAPTGAHDGPITYYPVEDCYRADPTADPFIDYANGDFRLSTPLVHDSTSYPGENLGSPYNQDWYGNTRGVDGTWDRGALEYQEGTYIENLLSTGVFFYRSRISCRAKKMWFQLASQSHQSLIRSQGRSNITMVSA